MRARFGAFTLDLETRRLYRDADPLHPQPSVHVWIDSSAVSRRHARLRPDGNRVVVEDLGSKNGTWVNGAQVTGVVDGDEIRFGTVTARLRAFRDTQSTQTAGPR